MWKNLGKNFAEFIFLKNYDLKCKNTQIIGFNYAKSLVEKNRNKKKGNFFSAHYGIGKLVHIL